MADSAPRALFGDETYIRVRPIGEGSTGEVWLCFNRCTGEHVAVKYLPRGRQNIDKNVYRELASNLAVCHPHIVRCRHVYLCKNHLALVFDYCDRGNLQKYVNDIGPLPEPKARTFFQQLIIAIAYTHKLGIMNRDIKLDNALLDGKSFILKLSDWGYSKHDKHSVPQSRVGTRNYIAPEVLAPSGAGGYDARMADAYSCGVFLYAMLFKSYPFERPGDPGGSEGLALVNKRMAAVDYSIPAFPPISEGCRAVLSRLLVKSLAERMSIDDVMEHPWFLTGLPPGWDQLNAKCLAVASQEDPQEAARKDAWIRELWREARNISKEQQEYQQQYMRQQNLAQGPYHGIGLARVDPSAYERARGQRWPPLA